MQTSPQDDSSDVDIGQDPIWRSIAYLGVRKAATSRTVKSRFNAARVGLRKVLGSDNGERVSATYKNIFGRGKVVTISKRLQGMLNVCCCLADGGLKVLGMNVDRGDNLQGSWMISELVG